ncbi:MAG: ATP-binding protein [Actinomycetota bacterium]|nr:ATP-binding protein [Actinomycetota bacterium]
MSGPGFRHLALGELDDDDLRAMLREGETLFVEFKKDVAKGTGFQIAKAAGSFANTLGGWILVGVQDGRVRFDWAPPPGDFVDVVRQRMEGHVDPLPSFAAAVAELDGTRIGVIRVYESADTPHILSDGSVVVREPAQDARLRKLGVYEPAPIRSHHELLQLAQRGREARAAADRRFAERELPLVDAMLQITSTNAATAARVSRTITANAPALVVRLAPLTVTRRWTGWAVSEAAVDQLQAAVDALAGPDAERDEPRPSARGFAVAAKEPRPEPWTPRANIHVSRRATAVADAGGVVGIRLGFDLHERGGLVHYQRTLTAGAIRDLVGEILGQAVARLIAAEHLGRYAAHGYLLLLADLYRVDPDRPGDKPQHPAMIPLGGELTVGGMSAGPDHALLAQTWAAEVVRSCGVPVWGVSLGPHDA